MRVRTILAADLELNADTAAKIRMMEAAVAPVRAEDIEEEDWGPFETAMLALGFKRPTLDRGASPFEWRFTFELEGMLVFFDDDGGPVVRLKVCEHVHDVDEWHQFCWCEPSTTEHLGDGYQIIETRDGKSHLAFVLVEIDEWGRMRENYLDCGEVPE